jgi:hypothetical protein
MELRNAITIFAADKPHLTERRLQDVAGTAFDIANRHFAGVQEVSRSREAELAQSLFNAQQALNIIGNMCGIAPGMALVTAVPKIVNRAISERDWLQEQVTHAETVRQQLIRQLKESKSTVEGQQATILQLHGRLAKFYPSPDAAPSEDRVMTPSDLPVPLPVDDATPVGMEIKSPDLAPPPS